MFQRGVDGTGPARFGQRRHQFVQHDLDGPAIRQDVVHAQQQALDAGAKVSGCTVHFVTEGVDQGPIIVQTAVPVNENDSVDALSARILEQEHRLYPRAIQLFAEGGLAVEGRKVRILQTAQ